VRVHFLSGGFKRGWLIIIILSSKQLKVKTNSSGFLSINDYAVDVK